MTKTPNQIVEETRKKSEEEYQEALANQARDTDGIIKANLSQAKSDEDKTEGWEADTKKIKPK